LNDRSGQLKSYTFDTVFNREASQIEVYDATVKPMLVDFLNGFNGCMIVYGQTGTGKSYTVGNKMKLNDEAGVLPRFINLNKLNQIKQYYVC
jgi:kinesin family protein 5